MKSVKKHNKSNEQTLHTNTNCTCTYKHQNIVKCVLSGILFCMHCLKKKI